ncbi:MAG: glycosyltransferase family 4 protein [Alphaproteobacteria bacterium]|uniref:Glycosyltransferase family 4 protein n=1 Tax=Candidatus Nitrobium versatile TaxID=2884831 RepID=A0A953M269_9BACT|nr:glycosyltransferase family 4 protein [Candidatus Nitrobium versatile]
MGLTVINVAYPLAPVRQDTPGGAEHVLSLLDGALVRGGHRSVVVACEGSSTAGALVTIPAVRGKISAEKWKLAQDLMRISLEDALRRFDADLVHMHGLDFPAYLPRPGVPVLVTLHLPLSWYDLSALFPERPGTYLHCVSSAQRRECPDGVRLLPDIENGVPVDRLASSVSKRDFALAMGRICPEKGFHLALDAARRAGKSLVLAGRVFGYREHEQYFRYKIAPRLDGSRYRFIGPIGFIRKRRFLTAARCLLVPSLAPETSSLVAMEALACGTPVIAFPSGALGDIVEHGRTGFLVRNEEEMAEAIGAVSSLSPAVCRDTARERFSSERMLRNYLEVYGRIVEHGITPGALLCCGSPGGGEGGRDS